MRSERIGWVDTGRLPPVERVFEYLRAGIVGEVYERAEDKVAAVEAILEEFDANPERVKKLTGWHWIVDALHQLPGSRAA